jgi:hypothetical protein
MNKMAQGIVIGAFAAVLLAMALATGILTIATPSFPSLGDVDVDIQLPNEARIVSVEPISLDCRARIHAQIPIEGIRQQESLGVVYRTDRVSMTAIGDVDTCVDGDSAEVNHRSDGSTEVIIPGESIQFVRPRVDTVKTAETVTVDRDVVGKLIDAFPWVDDNTGLTPLAYAYAQNVIGSSQCMEAAYEVTQEILLDAYRQQVIDQGVDEESLTVRIDGQPNFGDPDPIESGDIELTVAGDSVTCVASGDLGGVTLGSE